MNASPRMVTASPPTTTPTAQPGTDSRRTRLPSSRTISRLNCLGLDIAGGAALERDHGEIPVPVWSLGHRARLGHPTVPLEEDTLLEHHHRGLHVAVDPGRPLQLDPLQGAQVAGDFPVQHETAGPGVGVEDGALPDDEGVVGADLALDLAIEHDGATERIAPLDLGPFVDEGRQLASPRRLAPSPEHKTRPPLAGLPRPTGFPAAPRGPRLHQIRNAVE